MGPKLMIHGDWTPRNVLFDFFELLSVILLDGCKELISRDTSSLLIPGLRRSEIFGLVAGFGTTLAGVPDMIAMFRRQSCVGMNPRMAAIIGVFQILWIYYELLILSRTVVESGS